MKGVPIPPHALVDLLNHSTLHSPHLLLLLELLGLLEVLEVLEPIVVVE
jgi:hypothetical protein